MLIVVLCILALVPTSADAGRPKKTPPEPTEVIKVDTPEPVKVVKSDPWLACPNLNKNVRKSKYTKACDCPKGTKAKGKACFCTNNGTKLSKSGNPAKECNTSSEATTSGSITTPITDDEIAKRMKVIEGIMAKDHPLEFAAQSEANQAQPDVYMSAYIWRIIGHSIWFMLPWLIFGIFFWRKFKPILWSQRRNDQNIVDLQAANAAWLIWFNQWATTLGATHKRLIAADDDDRQPILEEFWRQQVPNTEAVAVISDGLRNQILQKQARMVGEWKEAYKNATTPDEIHDAMLAMLTALCAEFNVSDEIATRFAQTRPGGTPNP